MAQSAPQPVSDLVQQVQKALTHQKNKELDEAGFIFRQLVAEHPGNPDVLQIAAIFYDQIGDYKESQQLLEKVITKKPDDASVNKLLGRALFKNGEAERAEKYIEKAVANNFNDPEANFLMGEFMMWSTEFFSASDYYKKSYEQKNTIEAQNKLAMSLVFISRADEAEDLLKEAIRNEKYDYQTFIILAFAQNLASTDAQNTLVRAIMTWPERDEAKSLLGYSFEQGYGILETSSEMVELLLLCFQTSKVNHNNFRDLWYRQLFLPEQNPLSHALGACVSYEGFKILFDNPDYKNNLLKPLFIEGVGKMVSYFFLENLLTNSRRYYLERTLNQEQFHSADLQFLAALAVHCFFNEFVFHETEEETVQIEKIEADLKSYQSNPQKLLIYACYRPLAELKYYNDILRNRDSLPQYMHQVIDIHIGQILKERQARKTIFTSNELQSDDNPEENPHPRWRSFNFALPLTSNVIDPQEARRPDVLVFGCGTGKPIMGIHCTTPHANITATDQNLGNLAYSSIKLDEYGITNTKLLQNDMQRLDGLEQQFNQIEAVGVLHKLEDPQQSLNALASRLKDDGEIKLGLYSELARQDIIKLRQVIRDKGFTPDPKGIRECRRFVMQNAENFKSALGSLDFFSMLGCRDLLFNTRETCYTIPAIKTLLDNAGLKFEKFFLSKYQFDQYKKAFPDDPYGKNLFNWDKFEQQNPGFFSAMYLLKCKKFKPGDLN